MTEPPRPDFARLADWIEGRLPDDEARVVAAQVAGADQAMRDQVAWLRAFRATAAAVVFEAPPAQTHAALSAQFAQFARQQRGPGLLQRVLAVLSFDSALHGAAAGVRTADVQAPLRQLVYAADLADIALAIQPRPREGSLDLSGQLLPKQAIDPASFRASIARDGIEIAAVAVDELGEWLFEALQPGVYTLTLATDQISIVLDSIALQR